LWLSNMTPQTHRIIELKTSVSSFSPRARLALISA